ncbi:MAG TPA: PH domain-containing protein [Pyrinomonadaceae bacterium]|nr:PH domain-containing protein [Pyrinomonadaceae bacterium]
MAPEEETRVAARRVVAPSGSAAEREAAEIFSIGPTLMFVKAGYVVAGIGAVLLAGISSALITAVSPWAAVLLGLTLFLIPAFYHLKKKLVRYRLTDSTLEIDEGLISRNTRNIPIRRIQDVTVSSTATQRLLGFGDLLIDNASDEGGKLVLKNINSPREYADVLLRQMRRLES